MSSHDKTPDDSPHLMARGTCIPYIMPSPVEPVFDPAERKDKSDNADDLISNFAKLNVNPSNTTAAAIKKPVRVADPADFVTLQSLRSSALARKTNTISKFGRDGTNLFADLLGNDEEEKLNQPKKRSSVKETKNEDQKDEAEESSKVTESKGEKENVKNSKTREGDLLSRGPVRAIRGNVVYHPYSGPNPYTYPNSDESIDQACVVFGHPMQNRYDYGPWNSNRDALSSSSTPDTDLGYSSSSTSPHQQQCTSSTYPINNNHVRNTTLSTKDDVGLPDALSDFILKYSRSYRGSHNDHSVDEVGILSPKFGGRPSSVDSNICDSPLSGVSAPESSPSAPRGGLTGPSTPLSEYRGCNKMDPLKTQLPSGQYIAYLGRQGNHHAEPHGRPAKEVLRTLISSEDMDDAWAWLVKLHNYSGALCYQDNDKDSLLHIVTAHMDLAKIYALVEQMLKTEYPGHQKPFDMKNRYNETPLFLAIGKRNAPIVDYLMEAGADPNCQNSRDDRDTPLHLAAKLGMPKIIKTICSYNTTNLNAVNGKGLTPLLCAVINHGVYNEESESIIDNTQTIQYLLKFGANPLIADSTNGRTAMHYAITKMAPEILDVLKDSLDEESMKSLVNKPDCNGETALSNLQQLKNTDESIKFKLGLSLIICGANNSGTSSP